MQQQTREETQFTKNRITMDPNIGHCLDDYRKMASFSISEMKSFVDTDDIWEFRVCVRLYHKIKTSDVTCTLLL